MKNLYVFVFILTLSACNSTSQESESTTLSAIKPTITIAHFTGDYVTESYAKRKEGYDWMAVTISDNGNQTANIRVRSTIAKKKPSCTFEANAVLLNDSTLTYVAPRITGGKDATLPDSTTMFFIKKGNDLEISTKDFNNRFDLMYYCSGGGSLMGLYTVAADLDESELSK